MKKLFLLMVVFLSGCVTGLQYTPKEYCAIQDLKFAGKTDSSTGGMAYGSNGNAASYSSATSSISCVVPSNDNEKAEIQTIARKAQPLVQWNSEVQPKRVLNGIAWLFVIPGPIAYLYYNSQQKDAVAAYWELQK